MSNRVIPAEQLTQYQRWEMSPIFGASTPVVEEVAAAPVEVIEALPEIVEVIPEELPPAELYPTPDELAAIHQSAFEDGYQAGLEAATEEMDALKRQLSGLIEQVEYQFGTMQVQLADDMVELSVRLAEQVLRQSIADAPERLLPIVQEAIASSPFLGTNPRILLHPDDVTLLQDRLNLSLPDGTKWQLVADAQLSRGDCRLTAAEGEVDLSLEIRWKRVLAALGR